MKYILFEDFSGQAIPIIFPSRIDHAEMREQMPYATVLSAGHVERVAHGFRCHGEAPGLNAAAKKDDARVIEESFAPEGE